MIDEPSIFDCETPDYASVNEHGIWCDFCGHLLMTPYHIDEDWSAPEYCPECGAPDIEEMGEYFA